ncbi:MAG TPA: head GIN domain-containing protein [Anaerolineales bacterium]|nr:head GIN domain-containing protein [Anaerolineales bacterium]
MKHNLSLLLIVLFFLPALACGSFTTNSVVGSGNIVTQTIDVSQFDRVTLTGLGDVYLEQGQSESLSVQADDNLISLLDIKVRGKELTLGTKPNFDLNPSESIKYNLTVKDLNSVSLSGSGNFYVGAIKSSDLAVSIHGSGNIDIKDLNTGNLSIDLNGSGNVAIEGLNAKALDTSLKGSGDIKLEGNANTQNVTIAGSGNYLAGNLQTDIADVSVPGSGDVTIWANDNLKIKVNGSGNIQYYGKPTIEQNISGSGKITSLGEK